MLRPLAALCLAAATAAPLAARAEELIYFPEGNRLHRIDVDTMGGKKPALEDIPIQNAGAEGGGGEKLFVSPNRDVNGMICPFPDGSGRFVMGEDTRQPSPPPGFGVFERSGTQIGKLTPDLLLLLRRALRLRLRGGPGPRGRPSAAALHDRRRHRGHQRQRRPARSSGSRRTTVSRRPLRVPRDRRRERQLLQDRDRHRYRDGRRDRRAGARLRGLGERLQDRALLAAVPDGPRRRARLHADRRAGLAHGGPTRTSSARSSCSRTRPNGMVTFTGLAIGPNGHLFAASVVTGAHRGVRPRRQPAAPDRRPARRPVPRRLPDADREPPGHRLRRATARSTTPTSTSRAPSRSTSTPATTARSGACASTSTATRCRRRSCAPASRSPTPSPSSRATSSARRPAEPARPSGAPTAAARSASASTRRRRSSARRRSRSSASAGASAPAPS